MPLLTTKLYIPRARPELVSRPRLIERLNEGMMRKRKSRERGQVSLMPNWADNETGQERNAPARFWVYSGVRTLAEPFPEF